MAVVPVRDLDCFAAPRYSSCFAQSSWFFVRLRGALLACFGFGMLRHVKAGCADRSVPTFLVLAGRAATLLSMARGSKIYRAVV